MTGESDLARACAEMGHWLAVAETLLAQPDEQPSAGGPAGRPSSRPPWNPAVASALLDAHSGIRDLEAEMRCEVEARSGTRNTTPPARRRSDRSGNTGAVLASIAAKELAVTRPLHDRALHRLSRWTQGIRRLPAIDRVLHWQPVPPAGNGLPPACPVCGCYSLHVAAQAGLVACWNPDCDDGNGGPARGTLITRLDGTPDLSWRHQ